MKNFNIKRFWYTFRWYISENRGNLIAWGLGLAVAFLLADLLSIWIVMQSTNGLAVLSTTPQATSGFTIMIALIALLIAYSSVFSTLKNKQKRIAFLTLPATNLERYLTALAYVLIVWPLCIYLAFLLSDLLRMVVVALLGGGWHWQGNLLLPFRLNGITWNSVIQNLSEHSFVLWISSIYVLGGTLFRKRSFPIVTFALIILAIVFIVVCVQVANHYEGSFTFKFDTLSNRRTLSIVISLVFIGLSLLNFNWSYRIFKRFQIITSNWFNI